MFKATFMTVEQLSPGQTNFIQIHPFMDEQGGDESIRKILQTLFPQIKDDEIDALIQGQRYRDVLEKAEESIAEAVANAMDEAAAKLTHHAPAEAGALRQITDDVAKAAKSAVIETKEEMDAVIAPLNAFEQFIGALQNSIGDTLSEPEPESEKDEE